MGIPNIYRIIRNFLFSNLNKQFLVFVFFLLLSGIFWLIMTLNETYEQDIKIPVKVVHIPKNVVITSAQTDTVRATVRDKGWLIMTYLYGDKQPFLKVPFRNYDRGHGHGTVGAADLKRLIEQELEASTKVTAIKPEKLDFVYNNGEYKRVAVRWTGRVIPDQLYFISHVEYTPDSIDVYAPRTKLDSIQYIYTEPLNLVNFRDSLTVDCRLSHPSNVKVVPERVQIRFHTDVLTEETISGVPIQCVNLPEGKVLRTFPPKVSVHFVAGVSLIRKLRPEDFTVVADYREIMDSHQEKCNIYLRAVPHGVSRATLDVKQVDYLIEEE